MIPKGTCKVIAATNLTWGIPVVKAMRVQIRHVTQTFATFCAKFLFSFCQVHCQTLFLRKGFLAVNTLVSCLNLDMLCQLSSCSKFTPTHLTIILVPSIYVSHKVGFLLNFSSHTSSLVNLLPRRSQ